MTVTLREISESLSRLDNARNAAKRRQVLTPARKRAAKQAEENLLKDYNTENLAVVETVTSELHAAKLIGVPYLLSFEAGGSGPRKEVMGNGSAGWTVAHFATKEEARAFANSIPECSRTPSHKTNPRFWDDL